MNDSEDKNEEQMDDRQPMLTIMAILGFILIASVVTLLFVMKCDPDDGGDGENENIFTEGGWSNKSNISSVLNVKIINPKESIFTKAELYLTVSRKGKNEDFGFLIPLSLEKGKNKNFTLPLNISSGDEFEFSVYDEDYRLMKNKTNLKKITANIIVNGFLIYYKNKFYLYNSKNTINLNHYAFKKIVDNLNATAEFEKKFFTFLGSGILKIPEKVPTEKNKLHPLTVHDSADDKPRIEVNIYRR